MARFLELTADDKSSTKMIVNSEHIVSATPDGFSGTTKVMVPGVMFVVKESYDDIKRMLTSH